MGDFRKLFQKLNGVEVLKQYSRAHVLGTALSQFVLLGKSQKSLEILRLSVNQKVLCKLRKENKDYIGEYVSRKEFPLERTHADKIWFCWLQGLEQAPDLVQKCYQSLSDNLGDREIIVITEANYKEYVSFPEHIQEKYESGIITRTHFSDLLRLELLTRYGGTWIDATVFCSSDKIPSYMLESDLFVFQNLKPGRDGHALTTSSWFMTASTNQPIISLTKALLYRYWKKYNYMKDYYLIHHMFQLSLEAYPQEWKKVIPFSNSVPHILLLNFFENYDKSWYESVCDMTPFHKLSYKLSEEDTQKIGTYYHTLFKD